MGRWEAEQGGESKCAPPPHALAGGPVWTEREGAAVTETRGARAAWRAAAVGAVLCAAPAAAQDMPDIDAAAAKAAMRGGFGEACDPGETVVGSMEPEAHRLVEPPAYDGGEDRHFVLYVVACSSGAYNISSVFLLDEGYDGPQPQGFAVPNLAIEYEDEAQEVLRSVTIDGFRATLRLVNATYDPETHSVTSAGRWRGLGDASDSGTWRFEDGGFTLQSYEVDPTYDGEITPRTVFER